MYFLIGFILGFKYSKSGPVVDPAKGSGPGFYELTQINPEKLKKY
jgi:hypothetical protein